MEEYNIANTNYILRYHDLPGEDIPILFIHGLGCAGSFDYPQVATQKALKNHRCILVDLLGAGFSDKPKEFGYTVEDHAKYLYNFVQSIGLQKFILFGHSLGGAIALSLANICRDRVDKIILSESNLDKSSKGSSSKYIAGFKMNDFVSKGFFQLVHDSQKDGNEMWAASLSLWLPKAAYLISQSAAKGGTPSWRKILYSLDCPKTFIFGERSLPDKNEQELAAHGINISVVKNAGHSMAWENPKELAEKIASAIEK